MKYLCEKYEFCMKRETNLWEDFKCPHITPHDHYFNCDIKCEDDEIHCGEISLIMKEGL